jgi:hypothetical protein
MSNVRPEFQGGVKIAVFFDGAQFGLIENYQRFRKNLPHPTLRMDLSGSPIYQTILPHVKTTILGK